MYPFVQRAYRYHTHSLSFYSRLITQCLSLRNSFSSLQILHGKLIKLGFNRKTFLGNCCLDLYSKFGAKHDALKVFDDISSKNVVSWNICLNVFVQCGDVHSARRLFDEMPERDVMSWNSMISGYASYGSFENALGVFLEMQKYGIRPSGYTFSILISYVVFDFHGKEIHGNMLRNGVDLSNVVVGNTLIDMYGKLGLVDYATGVFLAMETVDVISWNSLISSCNKSGYEDTALSYFSLMRACKYSPDEFTMSSVLIGCSNLRSLEKELRIQLSYSRILIFGTRLCAIR